ncbi:hypothetical protein FRC02_006873 [Tulasnella sp. 418]|nr:hypothetical protein FRC02_006873 [Tulasnella sp. 418]
MRTTQKPAAQQSGEPAQPRRFPTRSRDGTEKRRRELQRKLELEQKVWQMKRKVKINN